MKFKIRKLIWEDIFLIISLSFIYFQVWGSYGDHKHYDDMYNGNYFYYLGPILDLFIKFANLLNLSSELFWKSIAFINAFVISYLPSKLISRTLKKSTSFISLLAIFSVITFPCTLFISKAGFAFSIYFIGFYSLKFKNRYFGYLLLILSSLTHLQLLIPSLITVIIETDFKKIIIKASLFLKLKLYKSILIYFFTTLTFSLLIISLGLNIKILDRIIEYTALYINYSTFKVIVLNCRTIK